MAGYILDSNAFLAFKAGQLGTKAREVVENTQDTVYLSLASIWELGIKAANGKLAALRGTFAAGDIGIVDMLGESGIGILGIELRHVLHATALPQHHRDPFDRMIIAQALLDDMTVFTSDRIFPRYNVQVLPT